MTDSTFETLLAGQLRQYAEAGVRPIDRFAIAEGTISAGRRRGLAGHLRRMPVIGLRIGPRAALVWLALLTLAGALLVAGAGRVLHQQSQSLTDGPDRTSTPSDASPTVYRGILEPVGATDGELAWGFASAALQDGSVAILGEDGRTVSIWDPVSGQTRVSGTLAITRGQGGYLARPSMIALEDGTFFLTGDDRTEDPRTWERFDPSTGRSVATGGIESGNHLWFGISAVELSTGGVLIAGGESPTRGAIHPGPWYSREYLWDPSSNQIREIPPMDTGRRRPSLVTIPDGHVLIVGGVSGAASAELYDPATETFRPTGLVITGDHVSAKSLADGRVLVLDATIYGSLGDAVGALDSSTAIYDPATGEFTQGPILPRPANAIAALPSGQVLVAGAWSALGQPEAHPWAGLLDVATGVTNEIAAPDRIAFEIHVLSDGTTVLAGGLSPADPSIKPDEMTWGQALR